MPTKTAKITIILNGNRVKCDSHGLTVTTLLEREGFAQKKVAVAINGTFVPKSSYDKHNIKDGDDIDIVAPMQGG